MTDEIKELFERIKAVQTANGIDSEFVFAGVEGRFTEHAISQASYRRCKDAGISQKSIHSKFFTKRKHLKPRFYQGFRCLYVVARGGLEPSTPRV